MKNILLSTLIIFSCFQVFSQTQISGIVVDESGVGIPFANVIFTDSKEGTTTDGDGNFSLSSSRDYTSVTFSFLGYQTKDVSLKNKDVNNLKVTLYASSESLSEVKIYKGKTSKKNNPAIDILRKIWANRRDNGVKKFDQYAYRRYEKLEFDLNTIDSALIKSRIFNGMEFIFKLEEIEETCSALAAVFCAFNHTSGLVT